MKRDLLVLEDHIEKSWARAKRDADRLERACLRIQQIIARMNGQEATRGHLDAYARVKERLASRWSDLEVARRHESEWQADLARVRGELRRIDALHHQDQYEN